MVPPLGDWTAGLQALVSRGVLPALPPLPELRAAVDAALRDEGSSRGGSGNGGRRELLSSRQLYKAVTRCVDAHAAIPDTCRHAATLLAAAMALEEHARTHSTQRSLRVAVPSAAHPPPASGSGAAGSGAGASGSGAASGAAADHDEELLAFLESTEPQAVTERLLSVLNEPSQQRAHLMHYVEKFEPAALATILHDTLHTAARGDNRLADGSGKRKLGGIFFNVIKRHKVAAKHAAVAQSLPPLPPLRPYQRDVAGMVLASWGVPLTRELLAPTAAAAAAEEAEGGGAGGAVGEDAAERFQALADGWSRNWIVCSPPNTGKTRMFIEVARGVLASPPRGGRRGAVVVVVVPQVVLTSQHAEHLRAAGLPAGTSVAAHSSDCPLTASAWSGALTHAAQGLGVVLVSTPATLLNVLGLPGGGASLAHVDLLVLDEAHHCKDDHPYAKLMERYSGSGTGGEARQHAGAGPFPRVLALTATLASERSAAAVASRVEALKRRLGARLEVVDEDDLHVAAVVPEPRRLEARVGIRPTDVQLALALQAFAISAAHRLAGALEATRAVGSDVKAERTRLVQDLHAAVAEAAGMPTTADALFVQRLNTLGQWLSTGRSFAAKYDLPYMDAACRMLDVLRKAVELVEDGGFEGALLFLARKAVALCAQEEEEAQRGGAAGAGGAAGGAAAATPARAARSLREVMLGAAAAALGRDSAATAASAGGARVTAEAEAPEPRTLAALRAMAAAESPPPTAPAVAAAIEARTPVPPPGNSCADVALRVSALVRELLVGGMRASPLPPTAAAALYKGCFTSGVLKEDQAFPKFWALAEYLLKYEDRECFHGIVFVKTRQAVFCVSDLLRRCRQLAFIEVFELIGHTNTDKRNGMGQVERHGRGMDDAAQLQVVQAFKRPGRKVLMATAAAEEGLDVPSCEFVVRYNAAASGIQLLQSRGRARQKAADFLAILQDGTLDAQLHAKSVEEEANMRSYQRNARR